MTTISAREFNHDVSAAKRAADHAAVIITDRGKPSHVLLSYEEYRRLSGDRLDIVDWLSQNDDIDVEFTPANIKLKPPEL